MIILLMIIIFLRRFVIEILGEILKNAGPEVNDERITEELFDLVMSVLVEDASEEKNTFLTQLLVDNLGFFCVSIFLSFSINRLSKRRL
jgi:hypothetical protein